MKLLAVIPARSGSKGVKDKNIRLLAGKPLLAYSVEAALESGEFDEVMVSTDSEKYAAVAREYGAGVPFLRSEATSADNAGTWDAVEEVLTMYRERGKTFDGFCLLQPTSPLRTAEDIRGACRIFRERAAFAVVSVCEAEHSPLLCGQLPENGEFDGFLSPENLRRRQELGTFYRLNGAIYLVETRRFKTDRFFYKKGSYAYIMPQERSVDIDTPLDFAVAEAVMKALCENKKGET